MPGEADTFKIVINEMTSGTTLKMVNLLDMKSADLTHEDLNSSIDKPDNQWNIHLASYD